MTLKNPKIYSPMPWGNGAYVIHKHLEKRISGYTVKGYNPYLALFPPLISAIGSCTNAHLVHSVPDYAAFSFRGNSPLVITFQNYILDNYMRPFSSFSQRIHYQTDLRWWTRLAVGQAYEITAVSKFTADLAKRNLNIKRPIRIIYNGIDHNRFKPEQHSSKRKREIRVFFSGNLTLRKGVQWLPAIASHLRDRIKIYYTQGLRTRVGLPPADNLNAIGPIPHPQMAERYQDMDMLLMPTVREGLSLSVLEAMACGLPIIASDCSSMPELVDDGKGGFLCPVGDTRAFAEKIHILADSHRIEERDGGIQPGESGTNLYAGANGFRI